jgi:hypothetical protein
MQQQQQKQQTFHISEQPLCCCDVMCCDVMLIGCKVGCVDSAAAVHCCLVAFRPAASSGARDAG